MLRKHWLGGSVNCPGLALINHAEKKCCGEVSNYSQFVVSEVCHKNRWQRGGGMNLNNCSTSLVIDIVVGFGPCYLSQKIYV